MQLRLFVLATLLCAVITARAADEHLSALRVGTETYSDVTVTSVTATHIYFTHSRGMANAKLKDLEPETQRHFHFDATTAAAVETEHRQSNAQYRQAILQAPTIARHEPREEAAAGSADIPAHPIKAKSFLNQPTPKLYIEKWLTEPPKIEGKFVLVDFWATWCGPCRSSIPKLNTLSGTFKDRLVVIGLSGETEAQITKMTQPHIEYAVALDTKARTATIAEVKAIPHAILIDPKGIVRFEGHPEYLNEQNLAALMERYQ